MELVQLDIGKTRACNDGVTRNDLQTTYRLHL